MDGGLAANRAVSRLSLSVAAHAGTTRRSHVYEDGPLRFRFPNTGGGALEAMIVNTAGGIAGGDRHDIGIDIGAGGALTVTTAAAEKVYRALSAPAEVAVRISAKPGARLTWLPQETIVFDRARFKRRIDADLEGDGTLIMAEAVVFGRLAMGEAVEQGQFTDRWRIRRDGRLLFAETIRFDGAIAGLLAEPAVAAGGVAVATVIAVPGDQAMVERFRAQTFCGEAGASAWNGLAVARLCAKDGAALRHDLAAAVTALGGALPRHWLN